MTQSFATPEGTRHYAARFSHLAADFFREADGLLVSSVGLGTYLGSANAETDELYKEAIKEAVRLGVNLIDTAINYRCMRSERVIGQALRELVQEGFSREELVISTKGGYVPFDGEPPPDPERYFQETYLVTGILTPQDLAVGCHAMSPRYLQDQLRRSLSHLGTGIDIYYLHNPETQLDEVGRDVFARRLRDAFATLEEAAREGKIKRYGAATWNGFRVPPESREHLGLEEMVALAREAGGEGHCFRVIQLPYNLHLTEAYAAPTQPLGSARESALSAAAALGLVSMVSVPTMQGRLARNLPEKIAQAFGFTSDAQRAIQFVRSTPGVTAALVGMKQIAHVRENLKVGEVLASQEAVRSLFQ